MNKQDHLAEKEIQELEKLDATGIHSVFFQLGVARGADLFRVMLTSYRLAARVANAAWKLVDVMKQTSSAGPEHWAPLQKALADYAPSYFAPHTSDYEFAAKCFEQFYEQACTKPTREEVEELIFQWTIMLQENAAAAGPKIPPKQLIEDIVKKAKFDAYVAKQDAQPPAANPSGRSPLNTPR